MDLTSSAVSQDPLDVAKMLESLKETSIDGKEGVICDMLLAALDKHPGLVVLVCETIAELAKRDEFRTSAAEGGILMSRLALLLKETSDVQLQAMRAIGNLCYEHDQCRQQFLDCEGCPMLAQVLSQCSMLLIAPANTRLKTVSCGCLLNLCNENDVLSTSMIKENAVEFLTSIVSKCDEDQNVVHMGMRAIAALIDTTDFDLNTLLSAGFPSVLNSLLKRCIEGQLDILEEVMEVISATVVQSRGMESMGAEWLSAFSKSGCVETLLTIDDSAHLQMAVDEIIHILSEDSAMQSLFDGGTLLAWTKKKVTDVTAEKKLRASAALVLANLARNDSNCNVLIKDGYLSALVDILRLPANEENCQLLYSALSALRNLSLPEAHKLTFLSDKVVDQVMVVVVNSSDSNILFKAFGCLRLLSTKAEICQHIVQTESVVKKVCHFCDNTGLPQIKIEGSRLLASLVKNSNSQDAIVEVVEQGGTKLLVFLLGTDHLLIQNEGLIALSIAAAVKHDAFIETLVEIGFAGELASLMQSCNNMEVIHNCLVLMETLIATNSNEMVRKVLASEKLPAVLISLNSHEESIIREKSTQISLMYA